MSWCHAVLAAAHFTSQCVCCHVSGLWKDVKPSKGQTWRCPTMIKLFLLTQLNKLWHRHKLSSRLALATLALCFYIGLSLTAVLMMYRHQEDKSYWPWSCIHFTVIQWQIWAQSCGHSWFTNDVSTLNLVTFLVPLLFICITISSKLSFVGEITGVSAGATLGRKTTSRSVAVIYYKTPILTNNSRKKKRRRKRKFLSCSFVLPV